MTEPVVRGSGAAAEPPRPEVEAARPLVQAALAEDIGDGDRTSWWTVPDDMRGGARIVAREDGVVCGIFVARSVFLAVDPRLRVSVERADGARVRTGEEVARIEGPLRPLLSAERTALNFLARLSGIATLTARYVAALAGTGCSVADTRKTTPGWRSLEKYAVAIGGGRNHRTGLHDMVLIKENHIRAAGGVVRALKAVLPEARREGLEVEVEVTGEDELREALSLSPDRVMLDNFDAESLRAAVELVDGRPAPRPLLEASGGVTLDTVRVLAESGVDYISVGALTHSAPALDYSLLVTEP